MEYPPESPIHGPINESAFCALLPQLAVSLIISYQFRNPLCIIISFQVKIKNISFSKTKFIFQGYPIYEVSTILFFLIPVGILLFLYVSMGIALHRTVVPGLHSAGSVHGGNTARQNAGRKQIIRMLGKII